jgi:hypothetical protein
MGSNPTCPFSTSVAGRDGVILGVLFVQFFTPGFTKSREKEDLGPFFRDSLSTGIGILWIG